MGKKRTPDAERDLVKELAAARILRESLKDFGDDEDLIRDTVEGETDLHEAIAAVIHSMDEDQIIVDGIAVRIDALKARLDAAKDRIGRKRALIEQAMTIGEIKTLRLPEVTLTVSSTPRTVDVTDETLIPSRFWKPKDPTLDRAALTEALKGGEEIEGARLDNGGIKLTIRRQ
ncbi:siphovirus Gp157 family protein [Zavarzinia compransoris]|uniref:siphovirus Gp157 family protein n=1 Tax=Zavarzinia marina TaxID=2911065 RepID=UPI001F25089B|nr:siphovirus Gp157 family protein [Zavarzinia marina]MCF4166368.1 siphovirus Gp157 family protein [Zavarzinia marina]